MDRSIPGNHDHWKGINPSLLHPLVMLTGTSPELKRTFLDLPIPLRRLDLGRNRFLLIAGIDTDADVNHRHERLWARGSFCTQIDALQKELKRTDPSDEVRVLLLHHSPSYSKFTLGICPESRARLKDLVNECRISVLLSGHVHVPNRDIWRARANGLEWDVLEARCGTTTQRDTLPTSWPKWSLLPNTLLVHRLYDVWEDDRNRIEWHTSLYQRKDRGFIESEQIPTAQSYFDAIWNRPMTVWPHGPAR